MKKFCLIFLFAVIVIPAVKSQDIEFGFKGGINLSTIKFKMDAISITPERAVKAHFGFFLNEMLADQIAISSEIMYYGVGYKPEAGSPVNDLTLSYIAIPLLLKYYPAENFNIHAGPQLSFLVGGTEYNGQSITEGTKKNEVAFGFGSELYLTEQIGIGARYNIGLTNTDDTELDLNQKSDVIHLALMVKF